MPQQYNWVLGINWSAVNSSPPAFLQVGFLNAGTNSVANPVNLEKGDFIWFYIYDTTTLPNATTTDTKKIDHLEVVFRQAIDNQTADSPFETTTFNTTTGFQYQGAFPTQNFGGTLPTWVTPFQNLEIKNSGRFLMTVTVTATNNDGQQMTWSHDPEMVVGAGGQGHPDEDNV